MAGVEEGERVIGMLANKMTRSTVEGIKAMAEI